MIPTNLSPDYMKSKVLEWSEGKYAEEWLDSLHPEQLYSLYRRLSVQVMAEIRKNAGLK